MSKINVLPFSVANLIAAGEVVDRPASVVKELMENAIDAGAKNIQVEIQHGGVTYLRVTDDGCGISAEDLPVSIRRHATSKIQNAEDLQKIITLGFRGEALAAISSVSDMRILSKTAEDPFGNCLTAKFGNVISMTQQGCREGTTVIVENLFDNVPARKKFLKKDITEAMAVNAYVERVALSHPEISFRLISDGQPKLSTPGDNHLLNAIHGIFGKEVAEKCLPIRTEYDGIGVRGYIGRTDNFRSNRNGELFFINGRYIKSQTAGAGLEQGYTSYMPPEKFPFCVLFLTMDPSRVDVNTHPAKLEVKFSNEKAVFEAIYYAVRDTLAQNREKPSLDINFKQTVQAPYTPVYRSSAPQNNTSISHTNAPTTPSYSGGYVPRTASVYTPASPRMSERTLPVEPERSSIQSRQVNTYEIPKPEMPRNSQENIEKELDSIKNNYEVLQENCVKQSEKKPVCEKNYRIIGECFNSYIIVEQENRLLLIDKHAAHERILFEGMKAHMLEAEPSSQTLMVPVEVMLTSGEVSAMKEYDEDLQKIGFAIEYSRNILTVTAIPREVEVNAVADVLGAMAGRILNGSGTVKVTRDILFEKALYQGACKAAIKAGRIYSVDDNEWLVDKLMTYPDITFCPHGRPVALVLTHQNLDGQFDRTGF